MISVEEARRRIRASLRPVSAETVALSAALGRVLAEDVVALRSQPSFDASAMDGYAVRSADIATLPARFRRIGEAPAGRAFTGTVGPGETVRIFTGAPIPDGADCIVLQEDVTLEGGLVVTHEAVPAGKHVRRAGIDFRAGDTVLKAGHRMSVRDIGLAGAMNRPWLIVHRRPRVALLATGDEIVMPGEPMTADQIPSSNSLALAAFVAQLGADPIHLGIAKDDEAVLARQAAMAKGCDVLITIGGASVGDHDLVQKVLGAAGMSVDFWKIAMRPGKPLMWGLWDGMAVMGLPGNPVSALICALNFLTPAIERLSGLPPADFDVEMLPAAVEIPANDHRQDYLRATLAADSAGRIGVTPFTRQDSSMLAPLAAAHCLVVRPPNAPAATAGTLIPVIRLDRFGSIF
ncbi:MAG TPA: gephyrin-like molybdotransferase Glp [Stellaceae bacterium]|nr:gephyrin-like molybdotransferase Glp [Stellaceae bacterium]